MSDNSSDYPIIEAIFEIRWQLEDAQAIGFPSGKRDPYYAMLLGKLYEQLKKEYPHIQRLDADNVPEIMAPYVLRQQFRTGPDGWPLVQVGPGIVTVNQTSGYSWDDFSSRISQLTDALLKTYPKPDDLQINALSLQYINAEEFSYGQENVLQFLKTEMKTNIEIGKEVFATAGVDESPENLTLDLRFHCNKPPGSLYLRIGTGRKYDSEAVVWNTTIRSTGENVSRDIDSIVGWAKDAHHVARKWFDAMTGRT